MIFFRSHRRRNTRSKLDVGDMLPPHGRLVPVAELYRAIGKTL